MCAVYKKMYGTDAKVITIHAGLECGIFSDKIEDLDCISMGPNGHDIHTTEERLSISSTARVWEFLKEVLKNI
jgi:dipeptidase D